VADFAPPVSDDKDALLLRLLGSDFLFWTGLHVVRDTLIRHVLATPPEQVAAASEQERTRVNDLANRILPVSIRAAGLRDDTQLGKGLRPYALETIRVPALVISARDDGFGTCAAAQYTASRSPGAKFGSPCTRTRRSISYLTWTRSSFEEVGAMEDRVGDVFPDEG